MSLLSVPNAAFMEKLNMCEIPQGLPQFDYRYPRTFLWQRIQIIDHKISVDEAKRILDSGKWRFAKFIFYTNNKAFAMSHYYAPWLVIDNSLRQTFTVAIQNSLAWLFVLRHKGN